MSTRRNIRTSANSTCSERGPSSEYSPIDTGGSVAAPRARARAAAAVPVHADSSISISLSLSIWVQMYVWHVQGWSVAQQAVEMNGQTETNGDDGSSYDSQQATTDTKTHATN